MPFGFRRRKDKIEQDGVRVPTSAPEASATPATVPPNAADPAAIFPLQPKASTRADGTPGEGLPRSGAAALPPRPGANGMAHLPLKEQASGTDARAERFFRQIRAEVNELKKQIGQRPEVDHQFAELDIEAVAANPADAALLPPEVLVKALVDVHRENVRLNRRLEKARDRNARLQERIREIKQARAYERGRLETLDRVIAALHANLEDLRLARDSESPRVDGRAEPRVLRPAPDALPAAENE
jgi:hypothetical protein